MKALIVTDLHGYRNLIKKIDRSIDKHQVKYLFCCGDLTSSTGDNTVFLLDLEKLINRHNIVFRTICGNSDSEEIRDYLIEKNWHLDEEEIEKKQFIGSDFGHEDEFVTKKVSGKLLFTHVPPRYSLLEKPLENCPLMHFAGHRHQIESDRQFPSTRLVQIKSAQLSRAALLNLKTLKIEFVNI